MRQLFWGASFKVSNFLNFCPLLTFDSWKCPLALQLQSWHLTFLRSLLLYVLSRGFVLAKMASIVVGCRTRWWGPVYIVGFKRVKVPSVRSIPYSTTWWVEDCGTYHGWLNRGRDWHTIHHKLVGERSEQMSDDRWYECSFGPTWF
jgi:hypothetical protein